MKIYCLNNVSSRLGTLRIDLKNNEIGISRYRVIITDGLKSLKELKEIKLRKFVPKMVIITSNLKNNNKFIIFPPKTR